MRTNTCGNTRTGKLWLEHTFTDEELREYREKIIKECLDVIKSDLELKHIQMVPLDFKMYANNGLGRVIKEHFGIE